MALCCWPCNCYEKSDSAEPDLMWNLDLYARLDLADAWAIIAPVNWYGPTSNLKLMFDRLVCMNGGNPREELIDHKDPEKVMALERSPEWEDLSLNHLEGRTAGFFCYSDAGANEIDPSGRPKKLSHKEWFDPDAEPFDDERDAYRGLVWQCRYSGIEVPDELWSHAHRRRRGLQPEPGRGHGPRGRLHGGFDAWSDRFAAFVARKGKVEPGVYRAYGYTARGHRWADLKLKW